LKVPAKQKGTEGGCSQAKKQEKKKKGGGMEEAQPLRKVGKREKKKKEELIKKPRRKGNPLSQHNKTSGKLARRGPCRKEEWCPKRKKKIMGWGEM